MDANPRQTLGARIRQRRTEAHLTLAQLRAKLQIHGLDRGISVQHLSEVERGGTWPSAALVRALDEVLGAGSELLDLLRNAKVPVHRTSSDDALVVTAHLFFPLFLAEAPECPVSNSVASDHVPRLGILSATDHATVHCFPFGVAVLHEQFDLTVSHLGEVAHWRRQQIERGCSATAAHLEELGVPFEVLDHDPYCFTAFVFRAVPWGDAETLDRATQVMAMPGVLLSGQMNTDDDLARRAEVLLMDRSMPITDVADFSHTGSHYGAATWAAVALMPLADAPDTDIVHALIDLEIQLQGFWCYASNVAAGRVDVGSYDPNFLRKVLAKLHCPSATEHTAVRRLREALVRTSRITELVDSAVTAAREAERI